MSTTKLNLTGVPGPGSNEVGDKYSDPITGLTVVGVGGLVRTFEDKLVPPYIPPPAPPAPPEEPYDAGPWTRPRDPSIDPRERDEVEHILFTMEYDGLVLELPSPILGDTQDLQSTYINRETRGGNKRVYRDLQWYTLHIYNYTFKHVKSDLKDDFLFLVKTALGDPIKVTDHLNNVYVDMYLVDIGSVVEEHNDECTYTINVTMQVVR